MSDPNRPAAPDLPPMTDSSPTPSTQAMVAMLLRYLLAFLGTAGLYHGAVIDNGTLYVVAGILVNIGTVGWALWERFDTQRKSHAGSVASANARRPLQPVTQ